MYADAAAYKNMRVSVWSANMELNGSGRQSTCLAASLAASLTASLAASLTATIVCLLFSPKERMRACKRWKQT